MNDIPIAMDIVSLRWVRKVWDRKRFAAGVLWISEAVSNGRRIPMAWNGADVDTVVGTIIPEQ